MSGKGKRGAQLLTPQSILCYMETQDNTQYPIYSGIYGKLLEINDRILENPNLILDDLNEGFLAIILPDMRRHEENMQSLTPAAEYN
ncbi:GCV H domain containing protein [Asbolus verrucosus]|uniref:GCV H domain containing protein n=1 Tax=Asbolus verrucosus TaxID=1661398 RepID=A0A482V7X4_ASBVE|nr:GCV H domain containing protein [Asbolus verrucosus]